MWIKKNNDLVNYRLVPKESDKYAFGKWGRTNKFLKQIYLKESGERKLITPISADMYLTMLRDIDPDFIDFMKFMQRRLKINNVYANYVREIDLNKGNYYSNDNLTLIDYLTRTPGNSSSVRNNIFRQNFNEFVNMYNIFQNIDLTNPIRVISAADLQQVLDLSKNGQDDAKDLAQKYFGYTVEADRNTKVYDFIMDCINRNVITDCNHISDFQRVKK